MDRMNQKLKSIGINKPTLVLDEKKVRKNIQNMVTKAKNAGVQFRPHFKTHQSGEIGNLFRELNVNRISVSSMDMADYFAKQGWQDITVAFLVNILEIEKINSLANSIKLNLLVDSFSPVNFIQENLATSVDIWIKVDIGYGRVGIPWQQTAKIQRLIKQILKLKKLRFAGLLTHFGQSYHATSYNELTKIYQKSMNNLQVVKNHLINSGLQKVQLSIGDTPCCSIEKEFKGVDEIRPGNFVFYDLYQNQMVACQEEDIAVAVVCPVVGKYEDRKQVAIYGGAVHFSKEYLINEKGEKIFGYMTILQDDQWLKSDKRGTLVSISQEHGILNVNDELFDKINIGDLICILPIHSCLTANLYKEYLTLDGRRISRFQSFF